MSGYRDDEILFITSPLPATITIEHVSEDGDDSYWVRCTIKFQDDLLNPPDGYFLVSRDSFWYGESHEEQCDPVLSYAQEFYKHLVAFRTLYGEQSTVQHWQQVAQDNMKSVIELGVMCQSLHDQLKWSQERVDELETDYVIKSENQNRELKSIISNAANALSDHSKTLIGLIK